MTTKSSLPAASPLAAPGGVSLDTPTAPAASTTTGTTDFSDAMSKANGQAKAPSAPVKNQKATAATTSARQDSTKPTSKVGDKTTTADDKKADDQTAATVALATTVSNAATMIASAPMVLSAADDDTSAPTDGLETKAKEKKADDADDSLTVSNAPVPANSVDASTTSAMLAMLSQPATSAKDLQRLIPVTPIGNSSADAKPDDGLIVTAAGSQSTAASDKDSSLADSKAVTTPAMTPLLISTKGQGAKDFKAGSAKSNASDKADDLKTEDPTNSATQVAAAKGDGLSRPAKIALHPVTSADSDASPVSQAVVNQSRAVQVKELNVSLSSGGTGVALDNQRMKLATEKNEIAGRGAQIVPTAASGDSVLPNVAVRAVSGSGANSSDSKKESADSSAIDISSVSFPSLNMVASKATENLIPSTQAASQAERIGHLVNQEVVTIRQSGASTLAVSLKVDAHTEIFVQLTNHNGQVQASVSCERGNAAALGSHWNDLQQSLAKQNVQLMPLEDKTANRLANPATVANQSSTGSSNFNQSSQNSTRQNRPVETELTMDVATVQPRSGARTTTKTASAQGWESWA